MRFQRFGRKIVAGRYLATALISSLVLIATTGYSLEPKVRTSSESIATPVVAVSAASYEAPVAADSIVALFGSDLATSLAVAGTLPLPFTLAGTTVNVRDSLGVTRPAGLFFVSSGQINCVMPAGTAAGTATMTVVAGNAVMSNGTVEVVAAAPGIFTATANGDGPPAADFLRVLPDFSQVFEPAYQGVYPNYIPRPIDLGPENQLVFLVLYLTGVRGTPNTDGNAENGSAENVHVLIGGLDLIPAYAGIAPGYAALDQINVLMPRALIGSGLLSFAVTANGFDSSNLADIDVATPAGNQPPAVTSVAGASPLLARDLITINGTGFAAAPSDNVVRLGGAEAGVEAASPTQLQARVQFGSATGLLTVATAGGQWTSGTSRAVRTSISGLVRDTLDQPIAGAKVTLLANSSTVFTQPEGWFVLPDTPSGNAVAFRIDVPSSDPIPYPNLPLKTPVQPQRDNPYPGAVYLQQASGPELTIGGGSGFAPTARTARTASAPEASISTDGVTLTIPDVGFTAIFPGGEPNGTLVLDVLKQSLTPAPLPPSIFSSSIAQIYPFGVMLSPGARLTFPNADGLPANAHAKLFKYDINPASSTFATFIDTAKEAIVTSDGSAIQTDSNAITETTYYFVALARPLTTILGRVIDSDGTPRRGATVRARGQEATTDGNGGFILRRVPCNNGDLIPVGASLLRSSGRVDRVSKNTPGAVVMGLTKVGDLMLPSSTSNRPPLLYVRDVTEIYVTQVLNLSFSALDVDTGQTVTDVVASGVPFAQLTKLTEPYYQLKLQPPSGSEGNYTIGITAADSSGETTRREMALKVKPLPIANAQQVSTNEDAPLPIALTGSDVSNRPLTVKIKSLPHDGSLSPTGNGVMTYTPTLNFNGTDTFTYAVDNGFVESLPATVSITVRPVNDAPVIVVPGPQSTEVGKLLTFGVTASDVDEGQAITLLASNLPAGAQFTQTGPTAGTFTWTPSGQAGQFLVTFTARDNATPSLSDSKNVTIDVTSLGVWRPTSGPDGGTITAFYNGSSFLLAGTGGDGVFRSTDNGASWVAANRFGNGVITSFVAMSDNQGVLAGTTGSGGPGVYRTQDGGKTWSLMSSGLTNGNVTSLVNAANTVYAGTDGGGVFRLNSATLIWTAANLNLGNLSVSALTNIGEVLYAGTGAGVYTSISAQSWSNFSTGLPAATRILSFTNVGTLSGTLLIAGTNGSGVYSRPQVGATWSALNTNLGNLTVNALMSDGGNFIFAGTRGGGAFKYSINQGAALTDAAGAPSQPTGWNAINIGLTNPIVLALASTSGTIFAGTQEGGIFRSFDAGSNWSAANNGIPRARVLSLIASGNVLFAGTNGGGVYASSNSGGSWVGVNSGLGNLVISSLAMSGASIFAGSYGGGVFRSSNGITWTAVNTGLGNGLIQTLAFSGTNLFAGTDVGTVYISANSGNNWSNASNGLPGAAIYSLFGNAGFVYAGTNGAGVYRSANNGTTWSQSSSGMGNQRVSSFAVVGNNLLAGTLESGVYRSTDNGTTWSPANNGLTSQDIYALFVSGTRIFAGSNGGGVFTSSDGGATWVPLSQGLFVFPYVLSLTGNGTSVFAGTNGGGVFILE
jgi:uncharacterized protein (TIGR03437 family)